MTEKHPDKLIEQYNSLLVLSIRRGLSSLGCCDDFYEELNKLIDARVQKAIDAALKGEAE